MQAQQEHRRVVTLRHLHTGCNSMLMCPLCRASALTWAIGQLGTWAALLDKPSTHHLSWQMLYHLIFISSSEQAQAGAVQPVTNLMMEQAMQAPVVVLVHRCLCVRLAVRERNPLNLQRDAGRRGDLARVAHGDLSRCTPSSHAKS